MRKLRNIIVACAALFVMTWGSGSLAFEDGPTDLGTVSARGPITLPLPPREGEIWIEIDEIDVTEFARIEGELLVIEGFAPLASGRHTLIIYISDDIEITEHTTHVFAVAGGPHLVLGGAAEIVSRNGNGNADDEFMETYGRIDAATGDGSVQASVNFLGSSRADVQVNGNSLDITDYLIEMRRAGRLGTTTLSLGHRAHSTGSLLIDDLHRRGVNFHFGRADQRLGVGAFMARADDVIGIRDPLGFENADDRIAGAQLEWRPSTNRNLVFSSEVYSGRGITYFADTVGEGEGMALSIDGTTMSERLRYGISLARAGWDDDAELGTFDTLFGNAVTGYLGFDADRPSDGARFSFGARFELVDYYYFSLANPDQATGIERLEVSVDRSGRQSGQRLVLATQTDARAAPAIVPRDRVNELIFDGTWWTADNPEGLAFGYGFSHLMQTRLDTPPLAPDPQDYRATTAYLSLYGSNDVTAWSVQLSGIEEDDRTNANEDRSSASLDLSVNHLFSPGLLISGGATLVRGQGTAGSWRRTDIALGMTWDIVPSTWALNLEAAASRSDEPFTEDGAGILLQTTYRASDRVEIVASAVREIGSFSASNEDTTTASLLLRIALNASQK